MTARFRIKSTESSAGLFLAVGRVVDGEVHSGQVIWLPYGIDVPVEAVPPTRAGPGAGPLSTLVLRYRDDAEHVRWKELKLDGKTVDLREPNEEAPFPLGLDAAPWSDGKYRHEPVRYGPDPDDDEQRSRARATWWPLTNEARSVGIDTVDQPAVPPAALAIQRCTRAGCVILAHRES